MEDRMINSSSLNITSGRNRVLRNTYALLGLSMVPTLIGAWLGVQMQFSFFAGSPMIGFMVFLGIAFGFFYGIEKTKDSAIGVALLLGFTLFMGLMLSRTLQYTLGFSNGGTLIALAAGGTGVIFLGMASLATVIKRDLSGLSKFLFIGVLLLLAAMVANIFLQIPALSLTISVLVCAVFSVYLLYDINRVVAGGETNYITATLSIYLDIYNIFVSLLNILGFLGGSRD